MIDLDDFPPEIVELVVDMLEHYQMYRLCIMILSRYKLQDRISRIVSAISSKYSNLNQFRILCTEKYRKTHEIEAQRKYAAIAFEAVQNVLSLVSQSSGQEA